MKVVKPLSKPNPKTQQKLSPCAQLLLTFWAVDISPIKCKNMALRKTIEFKVWLFAESLFIRRPSQ